MTFVCIKQRRYVQNIVLIIFAFACLHGVTGTANKAQFTLTAGVSQAICISTAKYSTSNTIQGPHTDASKFHASNKAKCKLIQRNKCGSGNCRTFECPKSPGKGTRIAGGTDALPHEFPFQIQIKSYGIHKCGGTLLNERYIISSADCSGIQDKCDYLAIAGVHNQFKPSGTEQERNITKIIKHESYNKPIYSGNDIALFEVYPPFDLTAAVQPVLMPQPNYEPTGDATVIGWGTADPARLYADILQKVTQPIITSKECSDKYSIIQKKILPIELCAGYLGSGGKGACVGDKGGPLLVKMANGSYIFVGIVAWESGCPEVSYPNIYTRVSKFLDWIYKNAAVNISQVTPAISEECR